jgi:hypothetical protein
VSFGETLVSSRCARATLFVDAAVMVDRRDAADSEGAARLSQE